MAVVKEFGFEDVEKSGSRSGCSLLCGLSGTHAHLFEPGSE